ncbi:MAG: DNA polymerase III subunit alpha [Desulfobacteraceae bacterium]|nr:DNA polymerase III subunit alpha [Desulfobacterales bacterium]MBL6967458.1 DNA polymerase III subunit alpha [Desulfobacteraceae bacterium]MBL7173178.1 DNA polymerase III subunit alpha [Desulfobacteraceae bacterium]MBU0732517.1 DNA polymerase III subunit alpha [Pseudomonadota bacterium]
MSFIHLNVHSDYSKGWGVGTITELCQAAKDLGTKRFALTDTNGLYGLVFFVQIAKEMGIAPIFGSELLHEGRRAVLIVKNREGYANLCHIISARHCHHDFDLIRALRERRRGLIIFSDDFSLLTALKRDSTEDLFVEMSPGYQMGRCYAFSRKTGTPPLATNRVYMVHKGQFRLHRILRAVSLNTKISRLTGEDICREHNFLNAPDDMVDQYPHAPEAISNTVKVAEAALSDWDFDRLIFPSYENLDADEAFNELYRATMDGCRERYGRITPQVRERVEHEMQIIRKKRFAPYFLVVADITKKARRSCGRGSSAASIVSYALGITHVDPIKHHLFFERFLNPGRMDPPDIDVDFAWDERDQVIDYAFARYGPRRTAMVANHNTLGPRSAIREVAKVFGLTDQEIGQVTGNIGFGWRLKAAWQELARHPKMREIKFHKPWDEILTAAFQLQGHFNHLSTHCGGVVIVPDEIRRYCPVEISSSGLQVLQWEKDSVEEAGLVKIDILGNRSLAVIRDALDLVEKNHGRRIDYARLNPINDPQTVKVFYEGDTFGVFYFESPATRQVLTKVRSGFTFEAYLALDHFLLNVVVTSIIRPASNQSIHIWISRLQGEQWAPPHPLLRPVLNETLGVMVFQEQLSQAAVHLAGFDPSEADTLRKTVSKKHKEKRLRDFYVRFVQGASDRGVDREVIEEVWQMMMGFDGYSFCKPHSASYTMVAYKSAYLRAHYPAEFMASVISNGGGYYTPLSYISEARRMGITVTPPDINLSDIKYTGKGWHIRVGFMQLKGLSHEAKEGIIHERVKNGPFISLEDFLGRTGPHLHLQDVRILIKGGCFDGIARGASRPRLIWEALRFFAREEEKTAPGLFAPANTTVPLPGVTYRNTSYPRHVMLRHESEVFGFILSVHPLALYGDILKGLNYVRAKDLHSRIGREVTTVGWPVTGKTVHTNKGESMKFITFEDLSAAYEAVFFPEVYHRFCHMLNATRPYILKGRVEETFGAINITVTKVGFLDRGKTKPTFLADFT